MDLLCTPADSSHPVQKTPYVSKEIWDGGPFLTFAHRKDMLRTIPPQLRKDHLDVPYLELLYPSPQEEQQSFYQTWFFFGLLAEFLSLNELEDGTRPVCSSQSEAEIASLYAYCVFTEDGKRYITGTKIPEFQSLVTTRAKEAKTGVQSRLNHLYECLQYTYVMLNSIHCEFDDSIRFSIAALAEFFTVMLQHALAAGTFNAKLPPLAFPWSRGYLRAGGMAETKMLEAGWCKSDIERARAIYEGLHTKHFLSHLDRSLPARDHSKCSVQGCNAAHIDLSNYKPSHAQPCCGCADIPFDIDSVLSILSTTDSFPVLVVNTPCDDRDKTTVCVEPFEPTIPYVAISHVWADGLGNPRANTIRVCQVARLGRLIADLPDTAESDNQSPTAEYRLWIDSLCCPVEEEGKKIALQRIADVYRNATHVLVLDSSLSSYPSIGVPPAESLMRIFASSAWMRRLWTLQEGALARSLYFQFADRPVKASCLMSQLFEFGTHDARYMRLWMDVNIEFIRLHGFFGTAGFEQPNLTPDMLCSTLQSALNYRSVSVLADEPLCIATLLSLSMKYIAAVDDAQERMCRVWELLSAAANGIPAHIIFYVDNPLGKSGWRWAPRSLLWSRDSMFDVDARLLRFIRTKPDTAVGVPTQFGLRVQFSGLLLKPQSLSPGLLLHPWEGVIKNLEDMLVAHDPNTNKWYHIFDFYRTQMAMTWTLEQQKHYDNVANSPLCRAIHSGKIALIRADPEVTDSGQCLMVQVEEEKRTPSAVSQTQGLRVRSQRQVIIRELDASQVLVAQTMRQIAHRVANDDVTKMLLKVADRTKIEDKNGLEKVRQRLKDVTAEIWEANPTFARAVHDTVGPDMKNFMWVSAPKWFSHDILAQELPRSQTWFVD